MIHTIQAFFSDKLPDPFNQIQVGWIWWRIKQLYLHHVRRRSHDIASPNIEHCPGDIVKSCVSISEHTLCFFLYAIRSLIGFFRNSFDQLQMALLHKSSFG
jgi:hypothetical protein